VCVRTDAHGAWPHPLCAPLFATVLLVCTPAQLSAAAAYFGLDDRQKDALLGGWLMAAFFIVGAPASLLVRARRAGCARGANTGVVCALCVASASRARLSPCRQSPERCRHRSTPRNHPPTLRSATVQTSSIA
jgi:hypothetical protein